MPQVSFIADAAANYCCKLTEKSKSNFYYAFLFLPTERREALEAVYA
jgi:phytoene/squalene synthetase